jgi:hypothetical protein
MELSTTQSLPLTESSPLSNTVELSTIEEIGIVIAAQDLTPTMMSQDFLIFSGIIPKEWELSEQPLLTPAAAQLHYTNGVSIAAQPRMITFSEALNDKQAEDIVIPKIAIKYIEKLPHADYLGISFSPKMLLPFPQNPGAVRQYIADRLLGAGTWKNIGKVPVQAGINLMYLLDHCQLTINVAEARLQQAQQNPIAALLFSGSFNYNISPNLMTEAKLSQIKEGLSFWQNDLNGFRDLIINKFLAAPTDSIHQQGESVFPSL